MVDTDYLKIIATVSIAGLGWVIAHRFTAKRDLENKKRYIPHVIEPSFGIDTLSAFQSGFLELLSAFSNFLASGPLV